MYSVFPTLPFSSSFYTFTTMSQQTNPTLARAPASVRKMMQIVSDPVIFSSIAVVTGLVGLCSWYYYSTTKSKPRPPFLRESY
jgi:hypothetical protein